MTYPELYQELEQRGFEYDDESKEWRRVWFQGYDVGFSQCVTPEEIERARDVWPDLLASLDIAKETAKA